MHSRPNKNDNIHRITALIANTYRTYNCKLPFHILFIIHWADIVKLNPLSNITSRESGERENNNNNDAPHTTALVLSFHIGHLIMIIIIITVILSVSFSLTSPCVYKHIHGFHTRKSKPSFFIVSFHIFMRYIIHVLRIMKNKLDITYTNYVKKKNIASIGLHMFAVYFKLAAWCQCRNSSV